MNINEPINHEKTKLQTVAVISCGFEVFSRVLNFTLIDVVESKCSWFSEFQRSIIQFLIHCPNSYIVHIFPLFSLLLLQGDHLRSGDHLRYKVVPVRGSFADRDHLRACNDRCGGRNRERII